PLRQSPRGAHGLRSTATRGTRRTVQGTSEGSPLPSLRSVGAGSPDPAPGPTAGLPDLQETCGRAGWQGQETLPQPVVPQRVVAARCQRAAAVLAGCWVVLFAAGCGKGPETPAPAGRPRLRVAYLGLTCEAPIFVAREKGFYDEEGLDVEMVRTDWDGLSAG